jgi:voltage-gated potassium channel
VSFNSPTDQGRRFLSRGESGGEDERSRLVFPQRNIGPIRSISFRLAIAIGALVATAVIVYVSRDCYEDNGVIGDITWIDAFYYATVSLSTTGYGDIAPICQSSRLTNIVIITPLRFLFLIVLIGTTIEVLTRRTRQEIRSTRWRNHVDQHTLIIGYGVKGRSAARALVDGGEARNAIVVVSPERSEVDEATRNGFVGVIGDARREDVLKDAAIEKASQVVIATNEDDTSVLVTLTARRLSPKARIVVSVREAQNAEILRQSGADTVIPTAESAGRLMGLSLIAPVAGDLMEDLLDSARGLELIQREITKEELGLSITQLDARGHLVLAVVRDGLVHRFDEGIVSSLQVGDQLVLIQHNPKSV